MQEALQQYREAQARRARAEVITEDKPESLLAQLAQLPEQAAQWVGERVENLTKQAFGSSEEKVYQREQQRAAFADRDLTLGAAAERQISQGERLQETAGDIAREGGEQGTKLAIEIGGGASIGAIRRVRSGLAPHFRHGVGGRVESAFAKIETHHIGTGTGTTSASRSLVRSLTGSSGGASDDAGHLIARLLGGRGGKGYVVPQNPSINRGAFRAFEAEIARDVRAGREVFVRVVPKYTGTSTRPDALVYQVRVDGKTRTVTFPNPP